jgi:uncharacterized protein (TIGR02302 family)
MRDETHAPSLTKLAWPLRLTRGGLFAEQTVRAFWPLWTILLLIAAVLGFELTRFLSSEALMAAMGVTGLAALVALGYGIRTFVWPTKADAMERLDLSMPGRPITAALDSQAIGQGDAASMEVWKAHKARMEARLAEAEAVAPDLRLSDRDPYALRYAALLLCAVALGFGTLLRGGGLSDLDMAARGDTVAAGPSWEIWIEPPAYTGKPGLYLNDIKQAALEVPEGSLLTARLYGEVGKLGFEETVSGTVAVEVAEGEAPKTAFSVDIVQSGLIQVTGTEDAAWEITVEQDAKPLIERDGEIERSAQGELKLPFRAQDDYGVESGAVVITLDLENVDRRYGLTIDPEPREPVLVDLPMPFNGARDDFAEILIENLSEHPWAGLPVQFELRVRDAAEQDSDVLLIEEVLAGRRFFQPIAKAVIEQRRDLLWSRENAPRIGQVLRSVTHDPEGFWPNEQAYLTIRRALTRMELAVEFDGLDDERRDEIAEMLWRAAMLLEDGRLSDALERLRRAQERLSEAMENGANDEEIAELMQELREAMEQYMQQLAQEGQQGQQQAQNGPTQEITGDQLQEMLDKIQELMEQGRMEEAEQLMAELMEMMENMQVAEGGPGQPGQQGEGNQAMEGLQDTLREQQGLSDEAFRDLQEQFNPGAQAGESDGNEGRNGGRGRGQSHEGEGGQGQAGNESGEGQGGQQQGGQEPGSLADRQQALREELNRQAQNMPGAGTPEGDAARDALGRAGEAMDRAEDALRDGQTADALGAQSDAMEALREGMRELGEAMAEQQRQNGTQGASDGQATGQNRDPLGREQGNGGALGSQDGAIPDEASRLKSRELLDEIRRRSGQQDRPQVERDYLERLLDRF